MKRLLLLLVVFAALGFCLSSCSDNDENNNETMSVTMWRDDSCVVTLPFAFGDDVTLPALDENTDESLSVHRYVAQNMAACLEFDGDSIKGLNEDGEVVYSGRYEYHRGLLTIQRREGSVISLKVLLGDRINLHLEEDITDMVKTLFPNAPANEYKLFRSLRSNV